MKRYFIGMLAGAVLVMAMMTLQHHHAAIKRPAAASRPQTLVDIREKLDADLTKTANDRSVLPEVRVDALAAQAKVDALFALDARMNTSETQIFVQQEDEHWNRVSDAVRHPHPKQRLISPELTALLEKINTISGLTPEEQADALATKAKLDALTALDGFLGTSEEPIFLQQEIDRQQRILTVMQANVR